jgi:hypothetical protein
MKINDIKCQQLFNNWGENKDILLDHILRAIDAIETGASKRSLTVAATWYNRFFNATPEGAKFYVGKCPKWIIKEL